MRNVSISRAYRELYPGVSFGLTLVSGCRNSLNPPGFDRQKRKLLRRMRKRENLAQISERIGIYEQFFARFDHVCPLTKHLKRTIHSGFPRYDLMVDAHFIAEMCAGILVAVADDDKFDGDLTLDVAEAGETSTGMGYREMETKEREILLRDEEDIVCILCQGADEKTRVRDDTSNVLFYAYAVPGIEGRYLEEGLRIAADIMREFGGGEVRGLRVY